MTDNELLEIDRIEKIQSINKQYDLENNAYLSLMLQNRAMLE